MPKPITPALAAAASVATLSAIPAHALQINPTYVDALGETWTAGRIALVEQVIDEWEALLDTPVGAPAFDVDITFTNVPDGYLGEMDAGYSAFTGDDIFPWSSNVNRTMNFNTYYFTPRDTGPDAEFVDTIISWFDPNLEDATGPSGTQWDLLSIARHEFAHMLGFSSGLYVEDFNTGSELDLWDAQITNNTFDEGGLDVPMVPGNFSHVADSATNPLMTVNLLNGVREDIDPLDAQMLALAYGYTLVPEPTTVALLALGVAVVGVRRRA